MYRETIVNAKDFSGILLIVLMYVRFLLQVILEIPLPGLEIAIYGMLLFSIDYRKQYSVFLWFPVMAAVWLVFNREAFRLVFIMLVCFSFYGISIKKIALWNCLCSFLLFVVVLFLLHIGILQNEHVEYSTDLGIVRDRNDLGMGLNRIGLFVSAFVMNLYVLIARMKTFWIVTILFSISFLFFRLTNSQTPFVGEMLLLMAIIIFRSRWRKFFFNRILLVSLPLLLTALSLLLGILVEKVALLDILTSGRLYYTNLYLHSAGLMDFLVGNATFNSVIIDNIYIRLLFEGGIMFYLFFYYLYYKAVRCLLKKDSWLLPVIVGILVTGLGETNFLGIALFGNALVWNILYTYSFPMVGEKRRATETAVAVSL